MPPRIPSSSCQPQQLLNCLEQTPSCSLLSSAVLAPLHRPSPSPSSSSLSSSLPRCSRPFSTTPAPRETKQRRMYKEWVAKFEDRFRKPGAEPAYLTSTIGSKKRVELDLPRQGEGYAPFQTNPNFLSEPVLSDAARETIWADVMRNGKPLKAVSAQYSVDMRRVAAVVRMKEIEKRMEMQQKPLATAYSRAIEGMLPKSDLGAKSEPFEPVNDIHVHSYTMQQLFLPTSESREFTRADAAKAFGDKILPPDAKMRIPELVDMEKKVAQGMDRQQARREFVEEAQASERELAAKQRARAQAAEEKKTRVDTGRFEFRFEKINAEDVGPSGRARKAVGWRYGVPFMDRRRGEVKIPTSVG